MTKTQYSAANNGENEDETPGEYPEIDHFGLNTLGLYFILSLPLILSATRVLSYVFTTGKVNYRCLIPECENSVNATFDPSWLPNAVPFTDGKPEACKRFIVQNSTDSCLTSTFTNETESCSAWVYEATEQTILNEWDLTCDSNRWKLTLPGTINHFGQFIGVWMSGYISDQYGRRNLLVVCTMISSIFGLARSFSLNYEMYIALEFFDAIAGSGIYSAVYVLGMEFVGPKKRILVTNVPGCMFVVYAMFVGLFAMLLKSWRLLLRVLYAPGLFVIFLPLLVPESVRWLQSKGRLKEAESVLRKIAAKNKIEVSEKSIQMLRNSKNKIPEKDSVTSNSPRISPMREVMENKKILVRILICAFCWVANTFVYFGLSLRSVEVPGDKYINFTIVMAVEIPAHIAACVLAEYFGRRLTFSVAYFLSGLFCLITNWVPEGWGYLPLIVFVIGKFCISINYNLAYIYAAEMFPTPIRHSIISFCSMIGRIGSMLAPQTPLLEHLMPSLPLISFGTMAILAGILSLNFPETLGIKLPATVHEAINIGNVKKEERSAPGTVD